MDKNKYFTPRWDIQEKLASITYLDLNRQSENYFGTYDVPTILYLGVNRLSLIPNKDNLVPGAPIYIQAIDSKGYNVEFLVTDKQTAVGARILNLNVKQDTAPGPLRVYITSRCYISPTSQVIPYSDYIEAPDYKKTPNIVWQTTCMVKKELTKAPPLYYDYPSVTAYEYVRPYVEPDYHQDRQILKAFTGSFTYFPVITGIENSADSSQLVRRIGKKLDYQVPYLAASTVTSPTSSYETSDHESPYLISDMDIFSSDMEGAIIKVWPHWRDIPSNASDHSVFQGASEKTLTVKRVINNRRVMLAENLFSEVSYVNTSGKLQITYPTYFTSYTSSITYNANPTLGNNNLTPVLKTKSISLLRFKFKNLNPETGRVSKVEIMAKPFGSSTPFTSMGVYPLDISHLYTSEFFYEFTPQLGLQRKKLGNFLMRMYIESYYTSKIYSKVNNTDEYTVTSWLTGSYSSNNIIDSLEITSSYNSSTQLISTNIYPEYAPSSLANTEYEVSFNAHCIKSGSLTPRLEVYIHGPEVELDENADLSENTRTEITQFGKMVATIDGGRSSTFLDKKYYFRTTNSDKTIIPYFIMRSGFWSISNINLIPSTRNGKSPNEAIVELPLDSLPVKKANTEYIFKIRYLSEDNKPGNADSIISGLKIGSSYNYDADVVINTIENSTALQSAIVNTFSDSSASFANTINVLTALTSSFAQIVTASFTSTASFTYQHNLDYLYPIVKVYDSQNELFYPKDIQIMDSNTVRINFSNPESGTLSILSS